MVEWWHCHPSLASHRMAGKQENLDWLGEWANTHKLQIKKKINRHQSAPQHPLPAWDLYGNWTPPWPPWVVKSGFPPFSFWRKSSQNWFKYYDRLIAEYSMSDEFVLAAVPFKTYIFLPSNGAATKVNFLLIEGSFLKKKKNPDVGSWKGPCASRDDWRKVAKQLRNDVKGRRTFWTECRVLQTIVCGCWDGIGSPLTVLFLCPLVEVISTCINSQVLVSLGGWAEANIYWECTTASWEYRSWIFFF